MEARTYTTFRLAVMMFLQFFVWGAWYGQMGKYMFAQLGASGAQVGNTYAAFSLAMIVAPFFMGMIADRYFAAQKVLGVLNLLGTALLFWLTQTADADSFYWIMLAYCLTFAPTISLVNAIAMRHIGNPEHDFPGLRVLGTISWIVVTNLVGFWDLGDKVAIFQIAMGAALVQGLFSFLLPDTPPVARSSGSVAPGFAQLLGADAFVLLRDRSYLVFFLSSILICIPLSFYYAMANPALTDAGIANVENKMSLGQVSEVLFMLLIPLAFARLGIKWMLMVGLLAWIARFFGFAYGDAGSGEWLFWAAILLHGICYDFFFVSGQIYTDAKAGEAIKSQAQGLISLATYGVGMYIGSLLTGLVTDFYTDNGIKDWTSIWLVPAGIAAVVLVIFALAFREKKAG